MATVLRGKNKGKKVAIHQFCNDWVMADGKIYGITALQFTTEEMYEIVNNSNTGVMFERFEVIPFQNRFRRKK